MASDIKEVMYANISIGNSIELLLPDGELVAIYWNITLGKYIYL